MASHETPTASLAHPRQTATHRSQSHRAAINQLEALYITQLETIRQSIRNQSSVCIMMLPLFDFGMKSVFAPSCPSR